MWPFGRKKEATDETRCGGCGRTLLAGEWTQRMIDDDGDEILICSLCSQSRSPDSTPADVAAVPGEARLPLNGRDSKRKSDAFWRALKEKDAEIEELRSRLLRSEAEKEELLAQLARLRDEAGATLDTVPAGSLSAPLLEATAESTDGLQEELEGLALPGAAGGDAAGETTEGWPEPIAGVEGHEPDVEDTLAGIVSGEEAGGEQTGLEETAGEELVAEAAAIETVAAEDVAEGVAGEDVAEDVAGEDVAEGVASEDVAEGVAGEDVAAEGRVEDEGEQADPDAGFLTDEELHLLQRGVDLLNVSPVPKKIAETSESLGVPFVHVAGEPDAGITVTFMWTLGWYRFSVRLDDAGSVRLADRGYEELAELQPNGTVRSDGTVQLAPTFGKRPTPKEETAADTEPSVSTATVTSGVIISKSLMGQRTDDEPIVPWENQNARDFDWGR